MARDAEGVNAMKHVYVTFTVRLIRAIFAVNFSITVGAPRDTLIVGYALETVNGRTRIVCTFEFIGKVVETTIQFPVT